MSICIHKRADDQVKSVKQGSDNQSIIDQPVNKPLFCLMTILHINIVPPLEIISVLKLELSHKRTMAPGSTCLEMSKVLSSQGGQWIYQEETVRRSNCYIGQFIFMLGTCSMLIAEQEKGKLRHS